MAIRLNPAEQEKLEQELRKYPIYMKPILDHVFENYSWDNNLRKVVKDSVGSKEMAHKRHFQEVAVNV